MASLSEHFEAIKAAIEAARKDGFHLYVDNMEPIEVAYGYEDPVLNLWDNVNHDQVDFPGDIWSH